MRKLTVFKTTTDTTAQIETDLTIEISELLADFGIYYRHIPWQGQLSLLQNSSDLRTELKREVVPLERLHHFPFSKLIVLPENTVNFSRIRLKFLSEYRVEKDEVLYFLEGRALLSFHCQDQVVQLLCEKGDVLLLPALVHRWLDLGDNSKQFAALLCTQRAQESILHYTGSGLADRFARLV